jgi:hypothetical protein
MFAFASDETTKFDFVLVRLGFLGRDADAGDIVRDGLVARTAGIYLPPRF